MRYRRGDGELIPIIVIIILNFLVYVAINLAQFADINLLLYLGLERATFLKYPWTIVTTMFTHQDFWHLLVNMLTFYFFGSFLNRIAGVRDFLLTYFIGGICSGLVVLLLSAPQTVTIGASGAIFALGGALAVITPNQKVFVFPIPVPMPLWVAILVGFLILIVVPGISWQGHLGGLVFGLLAGWYMRRHLRHVI